VSTSTLEGSRKTNRITESPPTDSFRPWKAVAFLFCFLWDCIAGWLIDHFSLPDMAFGIGTLVQPFAIVAFLYRTDLFRELPPGARVLRLFGLGFGLMLLAILLLFAVALNPFGMGAAGPA
jgi:hypothetical protein